MFGMLRLTWFLTLLPRTIGYLADGRVPLLFKLIPFLVVPFMFTPVGRLTNALGAFGFVDEFTVALLSLALFTWMSATYLRRKGGGKDKDETITTVIEGEYKVVDEKREQVR